MRASGNLRMGNLRMGNLRMGNLLVMIIVAIFAFLPLCAQAAPFLEKGQVRISGLTLNCPSCTRSYAEHCEMKVQGEQVMLPCSEMLSLLLREESRSENGSLVPTADELVEFLLVGERDYFLAKDAFDLLEKRDLEGEVIPAAASRLLAQYPRLLQELVSEGWGARPVLTSLWDGASGTGNRYLKASIVKRHPEISGAEFVEELLKSEPVRIQEALLDSAQYLRIVGADEAQFVAGFAERVQRCGGAGQSECFADLQDEGLRLAGATFLAQSGISAEENAILDGSARARLGALDPGAAEYVALLPSSRTVAKATGPSTLFLLVLFPLLLISYLSVRQKRFVPVREAAVAKEPILSPRERDELRELRRYFELSPRASAVDLVKRYHSLARELHPDTSEGDSLEFVSMNQRYKRARQLLSR